MGVKKVLVAMSGGVDSAAAALLLVDEGYEVSGGTFKLFDSDGEAVRDAKKVCEALGIPHIEFDFKQEFAEKVLDYFAMEYERGKTPNPCVICNREIKFGIFLNEAVKLGFDYVATGHYANILFDDVSGRYRIRRADFIKKDQSYVLFSLSQKQLGHILLPLGGFDKPHVRRLAEERGLAVSQKGESQDICFVPDGDYAAFLKSYLGKECPAGDFVGKNGEILGCHRGVWHYTIGQRKGLGLSLEKPMFVSKIDAATRKITLVENHELMTCELTAENVNWIDSDALYEPRRFNVKIRYGARPAPAVVSPLGEGRAHVLFDTPQRAATGGQFAVFYDGDYLAGGGAII